MARSESAIGHHIGGGAKPTKTPLWLGVFAAVLVATRTVNRQGRAERVTGIGRNGAAAGSGAGAERMGDQHERGRGRSADTPTAIPKRGWKDILRRVIREIGNDRVMANAAGVTYYGLLSIFPAIAALVSIYGLFADPAMIERQVQALSGVLPGGAVEIIGEQLRRVSAQGTQKLGFTFVTGLAIALWSANAAMKALFDTLNVVYDEKEKRGFVKLNLVSLAFTLSGILFILVALGAIVVLPAILDSLGLGSAIEWLLRILRWPLLLLVVALGLAVIYRYGPSRARARWRWISWGSVIAATLWLAASMLFSWYSTNFGSYNETYGSLGAIIVFMTWMWISATIILIGGEINAETEHQTARDTTTGRPEPLGTRGARMADTIGETR